MGQTDRRTDERIAVTKSYALYRMIVSSMTLGDL